MTKKILKNCSPFLLLVALFFAVSPAFAFKRDWKAYPAWIEVTGVKRVCAVGDIHGSFDQMADTFKALGVAERTAPDAFTYEWIGKDTVLVLVGDYTDRGLYSKQVYDAIHDLQKKAAKAGGQVIALMGNHEIMMINGQVKEWAQTLKSHKKQHYQNTIDSFTRDGVNYDEAISERGFYGQMIRNMPLFAVVNGYFFVHGGINNRPITKSTLAADFMDDIERGNFKKGIFMNHDMVLWNRDWWDDQNLLERNLKLLGVSGIVFGHTPGALGSDKGKIASKYDKIVSIDIGMNPTYGFSNGGGLEILAVAGNKLQFKAIYPDKNPEHIFTVPMPASAYPQTNRKHWMYNYNNK